MDADGTCLVVSPCNSCRINKNGVQACIIRKHNARLTAVKKEDLAARHRQCIKPDQAMTIFKLVDRDSGEESVEYAPEMVFQRACPSCIHLKTCIQGGHQLTDWIPEEGGGRAARNKRKSASSSPTKSPTAHQQQQQQQQQQQPFSKARRLSDETKPSPLSPSITIPGPALKAAAAAAAAAAAVATATPEPGFGRMIEGAVEPAEAEGRPRRLSAKGRRSSAPASRSGCSNFPAQGNRAQILRQQAMMASGEAELVGSSSAADAGADADATESDGRDAAGATGAVTAANGRVVSVSPSEGGALPQSISSQLDALALQEDLLLQQYQTDMRHLDEAKAAREREILVAQAALENIKASRETRKSNIAHQRKRMVAERDRLTHLRCQEVIREEAEHRQKKDVQWSAVEPAVARATAGGSGNEGNGRSGGGGGRGGLGVATHPSSPKAGRPDGGEGRCAALSLPSPSTSVSFPRCSASPLSAVTVDEKSAVGGRVPAGAGAGAVGIDGRESNHTPWSSSSSPRDGEKAGNGAVPSPKAEESSVGGGEGSGARSPTAAAAAAGEAVAGDAASVVGAKEELEEGEQEEQKSSGSAAGNGSAANGLRKEAKGHHGWQSSDVAVGVGAGGSNGNHAAAMTAKGSGVVENDDGPEAAAAAAATAGSRNAPKKSSDAALACGAAAVVAASAGPGSGSESGSGSASVQTNGGSGQQQDADGGDDGGDSMEVDEAEDDGEQEGEAPEGNGGRGRGGGGGGGDQATPVSVSKERGGGTTLKANGAGSAVKSLSAGGSGITTRHGARQGPPHGGAVS